MELIRTKCIRYLKKRLLFWQVIIGIANFGIEWLVCVNVIWPWLGSYFSTRELNNEAGEERVVERWNALIIIYWTQLSRKRDLTLIKLLRSTSLLKFYKESKTMWYGRKALHEIEEMINIIWNNALHHIEKELCIIWKSVAI